MSNPVFLKGDDEYCRRLSFYLRDFVNEKYSSLQKNIPGLPEGIIIRNTRNYDAINVPLGEFPLLKVYRIRDTFKRGSSTSDSTGVITYSVAYPDLDVLPDLLYWMGSELTKGLQSWNRTAEENTPRAFRTEDYTVEYLLTANEQMQAVYPFIRMQFNFKDMEKFCEAN